MAPVVDDVRFKRLDVPQEGFFKWNLTNICLVLIALAFIGLYKRATDLKSLRRPSSLRESSEDSLQPQITQSTRGQSQHPWWL